MEAMLWFVISLANLVALIWAICLAVVANRGEE